MSIHVQLVLYDSKDEKIASFQVDSVQSLPSLPEQMQKNSYSQAVMTPFGRPSIANQLRDNAILQLYLKTTNMYLAIDRHGNVINTANGNDKGSKYSLIC